MDALTYRSVARVYPTATTRSLAKTIRTTYVFYWVNSLVRRRISGPGLANLQWTYTYNGSHTAAQAASFLNHPAN